MKFRGSLEKMSNFGCDLVHEFLMHVREFLGSKSTFHLKLLILVRFYQIFPQSYWIPNFSSRWFRNPPQNPRTALENSRLCSEYLFFETIFLQTRLFMFQSIFFSRISKNSLFQKSVLSFVVLRWVGTRTPTVTSLAETAVPVVERWLVLPDTGWAEAEPPQPPTSRPFRANQEGTRWGRQLPARREPVRVGENILI